MSEDKTTFTFWDILKKWNIVIPVIQRDYAQGRLDEKTSNIRKKFIENIKFHLEKENPMTLDFVYGKTEGLDFIPLDGQQRLTTLFLLHWYSIQLHSFKDVKDKINSYKVLRKFTYKTRESAARFCEFLSESEIEISKNVQVSILIENNKGFSTVWKNDPTVKGMLIMIDEISSYFKDTSDNLFELLTKKRIITFQFLDMNGNTFKQSDSLYIKMNARGRPLTDFEVFKANFEDKLDKIDPNLRSEFSRKIDGTWQNNFFWKKYGEKSDEAFLNFFKLIEFYSRIINNETDSAKQDEFNKIDGWNKNSAIFLLNCLNYFEKHVNTELYFKELFCCDKSENNKICLFQDEIDLFDLCVNPEKTADVKNRILLFSLLTMIQTNSIDLCKMRIIRNLAWNSENELRFKNLHGLYTEVKLLCSDLNKIREIKTFNTDQIKEEWKKYNFITKNPSLAEYIYELENLSIFKGHITALDYNENNLKKHTDILKLYFDNDDTADKNARLFGRAMLYYGEYSEWISGKKYLYANSKHSLSVLLRDATAKTKDGINKCFSSLVEDLENEDIESIIQKAVKNNAKDDYLYYLVKYPEMLMKSKNGLTHWEDDVFQVACLTGETLRGWWYDPYLFTVYKHLPKEIQEALGTNFLKNLGYISDCNPLTIKNCEFLPIGEGWKICRKANSKKYGEEFLKLKDKLQLNDSGIYKVPKTVDRIEECCRLIKEIYNWAD